MAVKDILIWPDPVLKKRSEPVTDFGPELLSLINDIKDTMDSDSMAGLSAPQIGINKRVFLVDIPPEHNEGNGTDGKETFINPEILTHEGSFIWEEGCMSVPGFRGKVKRSHRVIMRYQNESGAVLEREAFYYLAGCFQHEVDHLNGILWIDYQSALKRDFIKKKMLKLKELPPAERPKWKDER
jgi:peptide deformylase